MLFADLASPEQLALLLEQYRSFAYPLLFIGAYLETLIPFSLIVYGEIFFIAGSILAGIGKLNIWIVAAVLYAGGILGDNSSYWLGYKYGTGLFKKLSRQPIIGRYFGDAMVTKGVGFFREKGDAAVFFARLCGPFSWFVPALAGAYQQSYNRFILFNTCGVILGIGEFLVVGYMLGNNMDKITFWLTRVGVVPPLLITTLFLLFIVMRYRNSRQRKNNCG